ncbi:MAG: FAD-dependent oxidoreductase, partial [FCB group bacterium]|nr:FAD-dependent oxidoreductase [FCB group bacterium]
MSDKLVPLSIHKLLNWIFEEYRVNNTIFGIHKDLFFTPDSGDVFRMKRYGKSIDSPIGVAAGPHTQMAQNIIAAWLCGARYIELKTIQTLDELEISKPCIDMEDEGYNCEWSQELKLRQSFSEYLKAWIIIHILKHKLRHGKPDELGGIFNLSAGYDLKGILNPNVQEFLDLMEHCPAELQQELALAADVFPEIHQLNIPDKISDNLTLSTMHGCPSDEIEKIAAYFLTERHYHTTVKLNPTLLGPERLRKTLHGFLKFNRVVVPDEAFEHDLKYEDALKLIQNLEAIADRENLKFGLKLTNTLEVLNTKQIFPEKEAQAYLSGRALHPISIQVAACLQEDFRGELDISFSAGVDAFNLPHVIACNIKPVTTCTDILKPGGYTRLKQYLDHLAEIIRQNEAESIDDYILMKADEGLSVKSAGLYNLQKYAESVIHDPAYRARTDNYENIKTPRTLTKFDCVKAPCITACATDQNIPDYMYWTAQGDFDKALKVILDTNPMPGSTGYVCDHLCQLKCTRNNIDNSLLIREIKRFAVEHGNAAVEKETAEKLNSRVAVIGAGPSGLSCAYFLARKGHQVVIFEKGEKAGGMVSGAIPHFRLADETFDGDLKFITDSGVEIRYHSKIDKAEFTKIQNEYDSIYLSTGAQLNKQLNIQGEDLPGVIEPLEFLHSVKAGNLHEIGTRIAIIGGGNTAIDAARTARRLAGPTSHVDILYRRTRKEMPADYDEIQDAVEEGIT